jgi:hypothetical protein
MNVKHDQVVIELFSVFDSIVAAALAAKNDELLRRMVPKGCMS